MSNAIRAVCLICPIPYRYTKNMLNKDRSGGIATWSGHILDFANSMKPPEVEFVYIDTSTPMRPTDGSRLIRDRVVKSGIQLIGITRQLRKLLKTKHIDVIHLTTSSGLGLIRDVVVLYVCENRSVPVCYHLHCGRVARIFDANIVIRNLQLKTCRMANRVICIDAATYNVLKHDAKLDNICYLPNPIPISAQNESFRSLKRDQTIIYLGWLVPTKGIGELLESWSLLFKIHPDWKLKLIGSIDSEYKKQIEANYSLENVSFEGELQHEKAMDELAKASIFVLPSYSEGFPNCVLEAMASGLPVVASEVGAISQMLAQQIDFVVPARDVNALSVALETLMESEGLRLKIGEANRQACIERYSVEKVFNQLKRVWDEVSM